LADIRLIGGTIKALQNTKHIAFHILAISAILVFFYACASINYYSTERWQTSTPEGQGMQSQILADMIEHVEKNRFNIDSILIVRNGNMVLDVYFGPFSKGQNHPVYSVTKSIMSALIGIAIDKGYIQSVDQSIVDFFPDKEFANMNELKKSITLENLLMMASGLECRDSYLYRWRGLTEMKYSYDWAQYVLDLPMAEAPGEKFEYCNGVSYLLSVIVQNTTKMKTLDFARKYLFDPLGIKDVEWERSPQGVDIGYGEMRLKPHDMAKFGLLHLNQGRWGNRQILPSKWVEVSTCGHIDAKPFDQYGYQWWVDPAGNYTAAGYKGQRIFVAPDKNLVAVLTADLTAIESTTSDNLLFSYIIPAVASDSTLPASSDEQARLNELVKKVARSSK
jgi:CubicO group peptidase (beta-lactamase class C family)